MKCFQFPFESYYASFVKERFDNVRNRAELQKTLSAVADFRSNESLSQRLFLQFNPLSRRSSVCLYPLTVRSCLLWLRHLVKIRQPLYAYFTALVFLQVSYKVTRYQLKDELLDVLAITSLTCLQSNDAHRRLNARHSSILSLSLAAKLMKVVANNSRRSVQLISDAL